MENKEITEIKKEIFDEMSRLGIDTNSVKINLSPMEILKNLDRDKFINWLKEEEKTKFIGYLLDNAYDYEEDPALNDQKNAEISKFISKYREYIDHDASSERKDIQDRDALIENKIEDFKKLRQRKLERLLNER